MNPIELEIWKPKEDDPRYAEYAGQPVAEAVFVELKQRLDSRGMLPDEYFLMAPEWENGREIPKGADVFVTTDYGESEGIYLDGYLKWHEDGKPVTRSFFTGKTLGNTGADLDRMFLISSAITKAFHGDGGQYPRYMKLGPEEPGGDMVVNLTPAEQRIFIDALMERRERMRDQTSGVEQLLRRMTGSITAYMDLVGERPLRITDFDQAVLAIHDGELQAFKELLPRIKNRVGGLLVEAAGRAGAVGRKMTLEIVAYAPEFLTADYTAASRKAVEIGDTERVRFLMEQAQSIVCDLDPSYYGEIMDYAYLHNRRMGRSLVEAAPEEWIAAAPPELLCHAILQPNLDFEMADALVTKGAPCGERAAELLKHMTTSQDEWAAKLLLEDGMKIENDDYAALDACVCNRAAGISQTLLERGMDFDGYLEWASAHPNPDRPEELLDQLEELWQSIGEQGQGQTGPTMEMSL